MGCSACVIYVVLFSLSDNLVKMLTAECQLERFLLENPPNDKNIDTAATELPTVQQELLKIVSAHPKVYQNDIFTDFFYLYYKHCPKGLVR